MKKSSFAYLILVIAALLWSFGGLFIKMVALSPVAITGIRSSLAAVVLLVYIRRPKWYWNRYFIGGIISYSLMVILYVIAIRLTTAANAIFLEFTAPIYVVILGYFMLNERITKFDIFAMAFIFFGMGLFFIDDLSFYGLWGNILALGAGVCLAFVTVLIRKEKKSSFEIVLFGNLLTAIICLPFAINNIYHSEYLDLVIISGLGIFQLGIPYILYTIALRHVNAIDAILVGMIEPVLNPIWVFFFIGEAVGDWALLGGSMVVLGTVGRVFVNQKVKLKL